MVQHKLKPANASYRGMESDDIIFNVSTFICDDAFVDSIEASLIQQTKNEVLHDEIIQHLGKTMRSEPISFFNEVLLYKKDTGSYIYVDLIKQELRQEGDDITYSITDTDIDYSKIKSEMYSKDKIYKQLKISYQTPNHHRCSITLSWFTNPQIQNGISLSIGKNVKKIDGMYSKPYTDSDIMIPGIKYVEDIFTSESKKRLKTGTITETFYNNKKAKDVMFLYDV